MTRRSTFRKNDVPVVQWKPGFFVTACIIGNEIKRKRWVDQEVNLPTLSTFFYSATNTTLFLKMVAVEYVLKKLDGIFYI